MKNLAKEHRGLFWLLTGVFLAVLIGGVNLYRPRDIRVNGRIEGFQEKQSVDLRLMFFDTEAGANVVRTVEYDDVQTTSDGRFDLVYTTSLASLPNQSYAQLCVRNVTDSNWDNSIPVCTEATTTAQPSRVQGTRSDEQTIVSCVRKRVNGSLSGLVSLILGTTPAKYEFEDYCTNVYTETEYETVIIRTTELSRVDLGGGGNTFITVDGNLSKQASLQVLSIDGNQLSISEGNTVDLPIPVYTDTDSQQLSLANGVLAISGGNEVSLPQSPAPQPFSVLYGSGLSGSSSVNNGGTLWLNNAGVLNVTGGGMITSTGGQNPSIALSLCANGEVLQVSGGAWICNTTAGTYTFSIFDGVTSQGIAGGDSLTFLSGSGLQSSVSATDTVTYSIAASGVGTNEIADGSVANVDLANSDLTLIAGSGLSGGAV